MTPVSTSKTKSPKNNQTGRITGKDKNKINQDLVFLRFCFVFLRFCFLLCAFILRFFLDFGVLICFFSVCSGFVLKPYILCAVGLIILKTVTFHTYDKLPDGRGYRLL